MNVAQMLASFQAPPPSKAAVPVKRNAEKAWAAKKAAVRKWFRDNMKAETWPTPLIAARRGQESSSCLPLLYGLEEEGFLVRAGRGEKVGRDQKPVLWKLANPPVEEEESKEKDHDLHHEDCRHPVPV